MYSILAVVNKHNTARGASYGYLVFENKVLRRISENGRHK